MSDEYRPILTLYPDVDGPLFEHLMQTDNASSWIRDALIAFMASFEVWPLSGPGHQYKSVLARGKWQELIDFIERVGIRRRHSLIRAAVWFQFGRLSVGHQLDTKDLARDIVAAMREQGVVLETSMPHEDEELVEEVQERLLGQFLA